MQSVPITTKFVSLKSAHGEVHSIQHYVIKFVSDLRQIDAFSPSTNKIDSHGALNTISISLPPYFIYNFQFRG